jgi:dynein light chain 1
MGTMGTVERIEEAASSEGPAAVTTLVFTGKCPPLDRIDPQLGTKFGQTCQKLSVSSNSIDRLSGLAGFQALQILSVGRNCLKRLDGLEAVCGTLRELWASYNQLERLSGIEQCESLQVLYLSNNKIKDLAEIDRLAQLPHLEDLLLVGNPIQAANPAAYRAKVLRRLPHLKKLDGKLVTAEEVAK